MKIGGCRLEKGPTAASTSFMESLGFEGPLSVAFLLPGRSFEMQRDRFCFDPARPDFAASVAGTDQRRAWTGARPLRGWIAWFD
jgi:hypothetical protein